MSPFDAAYSSSLENKISTQLTAQVPIFVNDQHPVFARFLKHYYEYLESGELSLTVEIDNILEETVSNNFILDEKGERIVTEIGNGSTGKFDVGETITGGTSKATAKILVDDLRNNRVFITAKTQFITGETVTGGTSGATGVVTRYRANPVQNIQQLLSYADADNTIYDFLDQFRDSFMNAIPMSLANGVDRRKLIKNIRELYRAKGTSEGHKIFMKMLLDENAEIFYPNKYMLRPSDGDWKYISKIRCSPTAGGVPSEVIGRTLTGTILQSDGRTYASAMITNASIFSESADTIMEFDIETDTLVGTFTAGETVTAVSKTKDVTYSFVVRDIVSNTTITNDGALYSVNDDIELDTNTGNGLATARVKYINEGGVNDVLIDDVGTKYQVGEPLTFTTTDTDVDRASGFVSIVDGSLVLDGTEIVKENGVVQTSTDSGDYIIQEDGSDIHEEHFEIELETGREPYSVWGTDVSTSATKGYYYPLYFDYNKAVSATITKAGATVNGAIKDSTTLVVDGNVGTLLNNMIVKGTGIDPSTTVTIATVTDQNNIVLSSKQTIADNVVLSFNKAVSAVNTHTFIEHPNTTFYMPSTNVNTAQSTSDSSYAIWGQKIALDGTDGSSSHAGFNIISEKTLTIFDSYGTGSDRLVLEEGSTAVASQGGISRLYISDPGNGYTKLPTVGISTSVGTDGKVLATSDSIGTVDKIELTNTGFKYTEAPEVKFRGNFVLKDVTGTFAAANTLTTHTGTVKSWDSDTNLLKTTIEDVVRTELEASDSEGIRLEDSLGPNSGADIKDTLLEYNNLIAEEDQVITEAGDRVVLDADSTLDGYIVLESGNGETEGSAIIYEYEDDTFQPIIELEVGTGVGNLINEGSSDNFLTEDGISSVSKGDSSGGRQQARILTEASTQFNFNALDDYVFGSIVVGDPRIGRVGGIGDPLIFNSRILEEGGSILLNGTDSSSTNENSRIQGEDFSEFVITLNGTDSSSTDANSRLLQNSDDTAGDIALNGTNSTSLNAGGYVVHDVSGIDFSAGTTTITDSGGATGTIIKVDIAKATSEINFTSDTEGTYGVNVESLISEDLIRIQDSLYYQQFSYEVQTDSGTNSYIDQLKKAVHPTGFNVFGKVSIASSISAAIGLVGSSLGGGYTADTDTYSPILASTFEVLFSEVMQRRLGTLEVIDGNYEEQVVLEDAELQTNIDDTIVLNGTDSSSNNAGDSLLLETQLFVFPDFGGIEITHSSDAGDFGTLLLNGTDSSSSNGGDKIISESAEALSNNLVMDSSIDSKHLVPEGSGDDLLLDGTDSSYSNSGESIELEDSISQGNIKIGVEPISHIHQPTLLNEDGGTQQLETSGKGGGSYYDQSLVSFITTKINIPQPTPRHLSTGAVTVARAPFSKKGTIELESGTGSGNLLIDLAETEPAEKGSLHTPITYTGFAGEQFLLEDETDLDRHKGPSFVDIDTYRNDEIVLDGTDSSSSNAGDNIITEDATDANSTAGVDILVSENIYDGAITIDDFIRSDILLMSSGDDFNTEKWATPVEPVGLLLEQGGENGVFKLEDETTASTSHGDSILLENKTGIGFNDNILLEFQRIELEANINTGTIPFENYTNSKLQPLTRSAEIKGRDVGQISLEDESGTGSVILNGTDGSSTNAGDQITFELGTFEDIERS